MPHALWLADVLQNAGLTIRPYPGWEQRGASSFDPRGVMLHHTVTAPNMAAEDRLLAITGSSSVPPPLCNYSTNRDGTISLIAAGRANHGGKGSWKSVSGNSNWIGDEMKNLGTSAEPWLERQLESARIAAAAVLNHLGTDSGWLCAHKEYALPPGRKTDPHTLNMDNERRLVAALMTGQEDDVSLVARLMVVEAGAKTWLPTQAAIDHWMVRADNLDNPAYAAEWRRDFEQMWAREKQNEWKQLQGHPHGAPLKGDKGDKGDPGTPDPDLTGYSKVGHGHGATTTSTTTVK